MRMPRLASLTLILALASCGGDDDDGSSDDSDDQSVFDPAMACRSVADAYADVCGRCPELGTYQDCYNAFLQSVNGDCVNVVDVRDPDELRNQCLPWFATVTCEQAAAPTFDFDSSCKGQLLLQ